VGDGFRGEGVGDGGLVDVSSLLAWWGAVSGSFESKLVRFLRVGWRGCVFGSG
jgi:hypothetical protein